MTTTLTSSGPSGPADPGPDPAALDAAPRRRRSRIPLISAIVVGCVAALLVALLATSKNASEVGTQVVTPLQNKRAPEITGPTLNGGSAALSSLRGKWVLLNFFASWCIPCQQEQPELVKFQNAHAGGDAAIFGVRFDDPDTGPIESLMSKSGATWPIVDAPDAKITYSVTGPPETFLISPGGIVLAHIVGPVSDTMLENVLHQAQLVVTTPSPLSIP